MGLLDDLKKQADLVKTQQILQQNLQGDKLKLVEDKMKQTFQYVHELLKQLAVVKPTSPLVYSIPWVADFRNLVFTESFIDYRKKRINDKEYFDTTHFFVKWAGPDTVVLEKDMPPVMQRIRASLWPGGGVLHRSGAGSQRRHARRLRQGTDRAAERDPRIPRCRRARNVSLSARARAPSPWSIVGPTCARSARSCRCRGPR